MTTTYQMNFVDSSIPGKGVFFVPEYQTEGPAYPVYVDPITNLPSPPPPSGTGVALPSSLSTTSSTSLLMFGKGMNNYGEQIQENILHVLENFASNGVSPVLPTIGQLWYDFSAKTLKLYSDSGTWDNLLKSSGIVLTGDINANGNTITNIHDPLANSDAASKSYVDGRVSKAGDTMTGALTLSGAPTVDLHAATKLYVDTAVFGATGGSLTQTIADGLYVKLVGSTMTGPLILSGSPTSNSHAATKLYVDTGLGTKSNSSHTHDSLYVNTTGDTMTGPLILSGDPTYYLHATTKQYVDDSILTATGGGLTQTIADGLYVNVIGDTMTGALTLAGDPTVDLHAATKGYVDTGLGTKSDLTHEHDAAYVNVVGDTMTGLLTLSGAPTVDLHAATKLYVDTGLGTKSDTSHNHDAAYVNVIGDTMTGELTLSGAPTANLHAATKLYVDDKSTVTRLFTISTGQTVFTTPTYTIGSNTLWVFVDGIKAYEGASESYLETSSTSITFTYTVLAGVKVEMLVFGV